MSVGIVEQIKRASLLTFLTGGLTLLVFLAYIAFSLMPEPATIPNPEGFHRALTWLYTVRSPVELFQILGMPGSAEGQAIRTALRSGTSLDYGFILAYGAFQASLIVFVHIQNRMRTPNLFGRNGFVRLSLVLLALTLVLDVAENLQIYALLDALSPDSIMEETISRFTLTSAFKWGGLAVLSLLLGLGWSAAFARSALLLVSFFLNSAAILILIALTVPDARVMLEYATLLLAASWALVWLYSGRILFSRPLQRAG